DEAPEEARAQWRQAERSAEGGRERDPARRRAAEHEVRDGRGGERRDHAQPEPGGDRPPEVAKQAGARRQAGVPRDDDLDHDERPERRIAERVDGGRQYPDREADGWSGERRREDRSRGVEEQR